MNIEYINEIWKDIKDYEGLYQVSNFGRVRSLGFYTKYLSYRKGRILKQVKNNKTGYLYLTLCKNGKHKTFLVHRLVAFAFPEICGYYFEGSEVNHKDENPENNNAENLEWVSHMNNINYGNRNYKSMVSQQRPIIQFDLNYNYLRDWFSINQIHRETGINRSNILSVCTNKRKTAGGFIWKFKE